MSSISDNPLGKITQKFFETVKDTDAEVNTLTTDLINKLSSSVKPSVKDPLGEVGVELKGMDKVLHTSGKVIGYTPAILAARALAVSAGVLAKGTVAVGRTLADHTIYKKTNKEYAAMHNEQLERDKVEANLAKRAGKSEPERSVQSQISEKEKQLETAKNKLETAKQKVAYDEACQEDFEKNTGKKSKELSKAVGDSELLVIQADAEVTAITYQLKELVKKLDINK